MIKSFIVSFSSLFLLMAAVVLVVMFQNCGKMETEKPPIDVPVEEELLDGDPIEKKPLDSDEPIKEELLDSTPKEELLGSTPKEKPLDGGPVGAKDLGDTSDKSSVIFCVEAKKDRSYDACVVNKNSVYEKKAVSSLARPDYKGMPLKAVSLPFLDNSGYLQNDTFLLISYTGLSVTIESRPLRFAYELDKGVALSQVTSYYYASLARGFSKDMPLSLVGQGVYLVTQAPQTGWSVEDNAIYLGLDPVTQHDSGLDGSFVLSLVNEANTYYASRGKIYKGLDGTHRDCRGGEKMCCSSQLGCSKAITRGLSHYFASSFFEDAPTVGESYSNRLSGIEDCGVSRDLRKSRQLSLLESFDACAQKGYIYPMATFYASVWWNVFQEIKRSRPENVGEFKTFYLEHLKGLRGEMNFVDVFGLIKEVDSKKSSIFTSYFKKELTSRGLALK